MSYAIEKAKMNEIAPNVAFFGVCGGFVVVIREGCGKIGGMRLSIFDMGCNLRWYLWLSGGFERFF